MKLGSIVILVVSLFAVYFGFGVALSWIDSADASVALVFLGLALAVLQPIPAIPLAVRRVIRPWRAVARSTREECEFVARALRQGLTPAAALEQFAWSARGGLRRKAADAVSAMKAGAPLSAALRNVGLVSASDEAILKAGEAGGRLPDALEFLGTRPVQSLSRYVPILVVAADLAILGYATAFALTAYGHPILRSFFDTRQMMTGYGSHDYPLLIQVCAIFMVTICALALTLLIIAPTGRGQALSNKLFPWFAFDYWRAPFRRMLTARYLASGSSLTPTDAGALMLKAAGDPISASFTSGVLTQIRSGAKLDSAFSEGLSLPQEYSRVLSASPVDQAHAGKMLQEQLDDVDAVRNHRWAIIVPGLFFAVWLLPPALVISWFMLLFNIPVLVGKD